MKNRVKKESFFLIPKFVDDTIAEKITNGLSSFFEEVENDQNHSLRNEITQKLYAFSHEIQTEEKWAEEFRGIKNDFLKEEKDVLPHYYNVQSACFFCVVCKNHLLRKSYNLHQH